MASNLLTKSTLALLISRRSTIHVSRLILSASRAQQQQLLSAPSVCLDSKFKASSQRRSLSTAQPTSTNEQPPNEQKPVDEKINQESKQTSENSSSEFDEDQVKRTILLQALGHVPKNGFTMDALEHGAIDAGLSSSAKNMFENGEFELIDFFYKKCNAEVNEFMESQLNNKQKPIKTNEFIRSALIFRLKLLQPYIEQWPNAMAVQTFQPQNAVKSFNNLLSLCDDIWYHAGDKSTDLNWYSKRLILASLYKSTELYMLQDKSPEFQETIKFLDNRFGDLASFYKLNSELTNVKEGVKGTLTVLKNIMNLR